MYISFKIKLCLITAGLFFLTSCMASQTNTTEPILEGVPIERDIGASIAVEPIDEATGDDRYQAAVRPFIEEFWLGEDRAPFRIASVSGFLAPGRPADFLLFSAWEFGYGNPTVLVVDEGEWLRTYPIDMGTALHSFQAADLDGDGADEVLLIFDNAGMGSSGGIHQTKVFRIGEDSLECIFESDKNEPYGNQDMPYDTGYRITLEDGAAATVHNILIGMETRVTFRFIRKVCTRE